jgi:hypothetical protein
MCKNKQVAMRKFRKVMKEYKQHHLKSSGKKVKSRKQAIAIAFSEARQKCPMFIKPYRK